MTSDLTILPIGSSSAGNAIRLQDRHGALLLDAGVTFKALQRALAFRITALDAVLISHEHGDHIQAVPELFKARVPIVASQGTLDFLRPPAGAPTRTARSLLRLSIPSTGVAVGEDPGAPMPTWDVLPFPILHDAAEPLGFYVQRGANRILYCTDTKRMTFRVDRPTHVLIEANHDPLMVRAAVYAGKLPAAAGHRITESHMSVYTTVETLVNGFDLSECQQIILLHLSDGNSDAARFQDLVQRATGIPTSVAGHQGSIRGAP